MRSPLNDALNRKWSEASATLEKLERELAAEREKIACIEMDRDHARLDAKIERERADRAKAEGIKEGMRRAAELVGHYTSEDGEIAAETILKEIGE